MSEFVTTAEASEMLGCSLRTIQRYIKKKTVKTKVLAGKTLIKRESVEKLMPAVNPDKRTLKVPDENVIEIANESANPKTKTPNIIIPDGYMLIDKETLESLRFQIKNLTNSVGDMQLTQKLLIQKGLNLKEITGDASDNERTNTNHSDTKTGITHTIPIGTESSKNDYFISEIKSKKIQNLGLWIALGAATIILVALIVLTFFTSK